MNFKCLCLGNGWAAKFKFGGLALTAKGPLLALIWKKTHTPFDNRKWMDWINVDPQIVDMKSSLQSDLSNASLQVLECFSFWAVRGQQSAYVNLVVHIFCLKAPPDVVTAQQRRDAEEMFITFQHSQSSFDVCKNLLGQCGLCQYVFKFALRKL